MRGEGERRGGEWEVADGPSRRKETDKFENPRRVVPIEGAGGSGRKGASAGGGRGLTGRIASICRNLERRDLELLLRCPTDSQEPPSPPPHFTMPFHQTPHIAGADCTSEALGTRWWGGQRKGGWVGNRKEAQFEQDGQLALST